MSFFSKLKKATLLSLGFNILRSSSLRMNILRDEELLVILKSWLLL